MGEAVNVGVTVAKRVGVTVKVWVTVARSASVGGGGVNVVGGVEVDSAKIPVPHPDNKIDSPMIKINIFFICFLVIEFPDNSQSVEREPGRDEINNLCFLCDDFGHAARGDDFHIASQFGPESCHHALDHAHIPKE